MFWMRLRVIELEPSLSSRLSDCSRGSVQEEIATDSPCGSSQRFSQLADSRHQPLDHVEAKRQEASASHACTQLRRPVRFCSNRGGLSAQYRVLSTVDVHTFNIGVRRPLFRRGGWSCVLAYRYFLAISAGSRPETARRSKSGRRRAKLSSPRHLSKLAHVGRSVSGNARSRWLLQHATS